MLTAATISVVCLCIASTTEENPFLIAEKLGHNSVRVVSGELSLNQGRVMRAGENDRFETVTLEKGDRPIVLGSGVFIAEAGAELVWWKDDLGNRTVFDRTTIVITQDLFDQFDPSETQKEPDLWLRPPSCRITCPTGWFPWCGEDSLAPVCQCTRMAAAASQASNAVQGGGGSCSSWGRTP